MRVAQLLGSTLCRKECLKTLSPRLLAKRLRPTLPSIVHRRRNAYTAVVRLNNGNGSKIRRLPVRGHLNFTFAANGWSDVPRYSIETMARMLALGRPQRGGQQPSFRCCTNTDDGFEPTSTNAAGTVRRNRLDGGGLGT